MRESAPMPAAERRELERRLELALAGAAPKRTVVARSAGGRRTYAAVAALDPEHEVFRTGCATKLLVAALVERTLAAHGLTYDLPAQHVLGGSSAVALANASMRHLLEHTHGLDDSAAGDAPLRADGSIDAERMLERLEGRRIAAPGTLYSYSHAGALIAAAVLETLEQRPFEALLRERLLAPLGIEPLGTAPRRCGTPPDPRSGPPSICPASGGALALTVGGLLTFLETSMPRADRPATPLPGWHPLERGVRLGWKCYAGGWLGHQSAWPGASLLVCARPRDGAALVVASEGHHAAVVAARALGDELPELFAPRLPKRLAPGAAAMLDPTPYRGRYASAAECVDVEADADGLVLASDRGPVRLLPAADETFFFLERSARARVFVQFIARRRGRFRALWDGQRVLPRAGSQARY